MDFTNIPIASNLRQINIIENSYVFFTSQPQHVIELITLYNLSGYKCFRQKYTFANSDKIGFLLKDLI